MLTHATPRSPASIEIIAHEPITGISDFTASTGKTVESATRENAEPETLTTIGDAVTGNTTEEHKRIIQMATTLAHQTHIPAKSALQRCLEAIDVLRIKEQARGELRGSINDPRHVGYYANKMAVQRGETGGGL